MAIGEQRHILRTMEYYPYGGERSHSGDMETDKLFTGQQREDTPASVLGLYNYGARFYSTLTGRFVSPDPIIAQPLDPQALGRFSYARNNPARYLDPTGRSFVMPDGTDLTEEVGCDKGDALDWLGCALNGETLGGTGCSEAVQILARAGIQQDIFWVNAGNLDVDTFYDAAPFRDMIIEVILSGPITSLRLNLIPETGWSVIGKMFGVSGPFLVASIYDLAYGSDNIRSLPAEDIIGAWPWWGSLNPTLVNRIENEFKIPWTLRGGKIVEMNLLLETLEVANSMSNILPSGEFGLNSLRWSPWQREKLIMLRYPIEPASILDPFDIIDIVNELACLTSDFAGDC